MPAVRLMMTSLVLGADALDDLAIEIDAAGALAGLGVAHMAMNHGGAGGGRLERGIGDLLGGHGNGRMLADRVAGAGHGAGDDDIGGHCISPMGDLIFAGKCLMTKFIVTGSAPGHRPFGAFSSALGSLAKFPAPRNNSLLRRVQGIVANSLMLLCYLRQAHPENRQNLRDSTKFPASRELAASGLPCLDRLERRDQHQDVEGEVVADHVAGERLEGERQAIVTQTGRRAASKEARDHGQRCR